MSIWRSLVKGDPIAWLLEDENPAAQFFTLTDILDKPKDDPEVVKAKQAIMQNGVVPKIMDKQNQEGFWENQESFYTAKYKGTVWQLMILAELGAAGEDERIRKACEYILVNAQDRESGGFSINTAAKTGGGRHSEVR